MIEWETYYIINCNTKLGDGGSLIVIPLLVLGFQCCVT